MKSKVVLLALIATVVLTSSAAAFQARKIACVAQVGEFVTAITDGEVGWVTDGSSVANFGDCDVPPDFFGPGSLPLGNNDIPLNGTPLSNATGNLDTLVEVDGITCLRVGETKSMNTRIRALHMSSNDPVPVFFSDGSVEFYDLDVHSSVNQNQGSITMSLDHEFGGMFSSTLPVQARLVFTPLAAGAPLVLEDPACELHFDSQTVPWSLSGPGKFVPADNNLDPLPAGVAIDGDGDGTPDYITTGRSNFIPGVEAVGAGGGLTGDSAVGASIGISWRYWLFREIYLLIKHFVWIKRIDFIDGQPADPNVEVVR